MFCHTNCYNYEANHTNNFISVLTNGVPFKFKWILIGCQRLIVLQFSGLKKSLTMIPILCNVTGNRLI